MKVTFSITDENAEERCARFVSELVRQGVKFEMKEVGNDYVITFTGGF